MDLTSVDVSLDDIIRMNKNKAVKKVSNGGGFHKGGYNRNNHRGPDLKRQQHNRWSVANTSKQFQQQPQQPQQPVVRNSPKILVSNLAPSVTAADLEELFSGVGELQTFPVLHHDAKGKSLGSAEITFQLRADARKALTKYSGVTLDRQAMRIQFTLNGEGGAMAGRLGPSLAAPPTPTTLHQAQATQIRQVVQSRQVVMGGRNQQAFGVGGGGRRSLGPRDGGGFGGGGDQRHNGKKKSNEQIDPTKLDLEMDAYMESHPANAMC